MKKSILFLLTVFCVMAMSACQSSAPVGSYPKGASWCGALDMAGNVWEWVEDWHGDYSTGEQWL